MLVVLHKGLEQEEEHGEEGEQVELVPLVGSQEEPDRGHDDDKDKRGGNLFVRVLRVLGWGEPDKEVCWGGGGERMMAAVQHVNKARVVASTRKETALPLPPPKQPNTNTPTTKTQKHKHTHTT